eukprot:TRINITY_DN2077_c0_g3_i1.p1 TRINITY_DN2077_c0_g3~~TRINITY_DN2077_c0_g3_i1.p1  ORF type:complete len:170 (+),score=6.45 TRINITY_DN2077_c0_g3_i1:243-752(+)
MTLDYIVRKGFLNVNSEVYVKSHPELTGIISKLSNDRYGHSHKCSKCNFGSSTPTNFMRMLNRSHEVKEPTRPWNIIISSKNRRNLKSHKYDLLEYKIVRTLSNYKDVKQVYIADINETHRGFVIDIVIDLHKFLEQHPELNEPNIYKIICSKPSKIVQERVHMWILST